TIIYVCEAPSITLIYNKYLYLHCIALKKSHRWKFPVDTLPSDADTFQVLHTHDNGYPPKFYAFLFPPAQG
ncbi:TPA: hypothetical protein ACNRKG_003011, partial [Escherichia coli]